MAGVEAIGVTAIEDAIDKLTKLASEARWGIVLIDSTIMDSLPDRVKERLLNSSAPWFMETTLSLTEGASDEESDAKHTVERMIQQAVGKKIAIT
jgi:vacuolar-type H+-ATPase subunit F/Vma7